MLRNRICCLFLLLFAAMAVPLYGQQRMTKMFQSMVIDPFDTNVIVGSTRMRDEKVTNQNAYGAYTSTIYVSQDDGDNWVAKRTPWGFTEVVELHMDMRNRGTVYALLNASSGILWRSDDGGSTWQAASGGIASRPLAYPFSLYSDANQGILFLQLGAVLYKSTDKGTTWTKQADIPCSSRIEINTGDPNRMYCTTGIGDQVSRSVNQGVSWQQGPKIAGASGPFTAITSSRLLSDPQSPDTLLISLFGIVGGFQHDSVYRSTNGGVSATRMSDMPGLHRVHASRDRRLVLITGSGNTAKRSSNLGQTWTSMSAISGLDTARHDYIVFAPYDNNRGWMLSASKRTTDAAMTFQSVVSQVEVIPVANFTQPIKQILRRGTSYLMTLPLRDSDRQTTSPTVAKALSNVAWINWLGESNFMLSGSTVGIGDYAGSFLVGNASHQLDVKFELHVVEADDPLMKFQVETVYGNGATYHYTVIEQEGPLPSEGQQAKQVPFACCGPVAASPDGSTYQSARLRILKIAPDGVVTSFAGTGAAAPFAIADTEKGKLAVQAKFRNITAMVWTTAGLVFADSGTHQIWRIGSDGRLVNLYNGLAAGNEDLNYEGSVAVASNGTIYFGGPLGLYRVGAGGKSERVFFNSEVVSAGGGVTGLLAEPDGSLVITYGNAIYRRSVAGAVQLLAGVAGRPGFGGDGVAWAINALEVPATTNRSDKAEITRAITVAPPTTPTTPTPTNPQTPDPYVFPDDALLHDAKYPVRDSRGNIYFLDNYRVRVLSPDGRLDTVVGNGDISPTLGENAIATSASSGALYGLATNSSGNLLVSTAQRVYKTRAQGTTPDPQPNQGGAVSLAAGSPSVAPGAIFSIYGTNLSATTGEAPRVPIPTRMGGVEVRVNGRAVPLFYVSPLQINAQMPQDVAPGQAQVTVVRDGKVSGTITVEVIAAAPDILVYDTNRVVALDESYRLVGPDNPAKPGKYLLVYLTGIGPVNPIVTAGQAASGDTLSRATLDANSVIGGQSATISFLGLAPNFVGLAQANIQVPENLPEGNHELVLTVGGKPSNKVMVLVQP